jgi:Mg-chelatase subunit ChlD
MERENRLELVKQALFLLLDQMDRRDRVALVVYGSDARVVLPPTSLAERRVLENAIARLVPEGSTNAAAGLREGYALAARAFDRGDLNRVILCSDGGIAGTTDAEGSGQGSEAATHLTTRIGMGTTTTSLWKARPGRRNYTWMSCRGPACSGEPDRTSRPSPRRQDPGGVRLEQVRR